MISDDLSLSQTSRWSQMTSDLRLYHRSSQIISDDIPIISDYLRLADDWQMISDDLRSQITSDYITGHPRLSQTSKWSQITSDLRSSLSILPIISDYLRLANDLRLPQISDRLWLSYRSSQIISDAIPIISDYLRLANDPRLPQIFHHLRLYTGHLGLNSD